MKFERYSEPVLPHALWLRRICKSVWLAFVIILIALAIGVVGYHCIGGLPWVDAILESSMILGGMGAVAHMDTTAIKLFASAYALFSGFVVLTTAAIILAPWLHRLLHKLNAKT